MFTVNALLPRENQYLIKYVYCMFTFLGIASVFQGGGAAEAKIRQVEAKVMNKTH